MADPIDLSDSLNRLQVAMDSLQGPSGVLVNALRNVGNIASQTATHLGALTAPFSILGATLSGIGELLTKAGAAATKGGGTPGSAGAAGAAGVAGAAGDVADGLGSGMAALGPEMAAIGAAVTAATQTFEKVVSVMQSFAEVAAPAVIAEFNRALKDLQATVGTAFVPFFEVMIGITRQIAAELYRP